MYLAIASYEYVAKPFFLGIILKDVKVFERFGSGVGAITPLPLTLIFHHFYFLTFFQLFFFLKYFYSIVEIESRFF